MFQLFIDRQLDRKQVEGILASYFGPTESIATYDSLADMLEREGDLDSIAFFLRPLSETYPLMLEVWLPRPTNLQDEEHFAQHVSRLAGCRTIITDEELNPYSWRCVHPSGRIETIRLTDADMGWETD